MRKLVTILAALITIVSCPTFADLMSVTFTNRTPPTQQSPAMFESVRNGLVIVRTKQTCGTGFIVEMNGKRYLMTNAHVLHDARKMTLQTLSGAKLPWTSIELADKHDLARILLADSLPNVLALPIATNRITMNEPVVVYGNSEGRNVATELKGRILGIGPENIETDAEFVRGNSGSPILNAKGEVIAVATYVTRTAPGTDWVADNTRFTVTRRFGVRLTDISWIPVEPSVLQKQVSILADVDRFIGDTFSIIPNWLPGVQSSCRRAARDALHMYSAKREESNYTNPAWPRLVETFCQTYIDSSSKQREDWKSNLHGIWSPQSYTYRNAERQHMASVKALTTERDRLLLSLYETPEKTLADTIWVTGFLKEEALARKDVLAFLKECIATIKEPSSWGNNVWGWGNYVPPYNVKEKPPSGTPK